MTILKKTVLLLAIASLNAYSSGNIYPVKEKDASEEVIERAAKVDIKKQFDKNQDDWTVFKGVHLPVSTANRVRKHIPFYVNEIEVKDPKSGIVQYPIGYTFNILEHLPKLPFRVIVARPDQVDWVKSIKKPEDIIYFTNGNVKKIGDKLGVSAGILSEPVIKRFDFKSAPTIAVQVKKYIQLTEIDYPEWKKQHEK